MMDFVWKQPPTARRRRQRPALRSSPPRPRSSIVDDFRERFGIEAFVEVFGLTETSMPILTPYGDARVRPARPVCCVDDWFDIRLVDPETDEEVPGRRGRRAASCARSCRGPPASATTACPTRRSRRRATSGSTPATACAATPTAGTTSSTASRTRSAAAGENISSYEVEQADPRPPGRRRVRRGRRARRRRGRRGRGHGGARARARVQRHGRRGLGVVRRAHPRVRGPALPALRRNVCRRRRRRRSARWRCARRVSPRRHGTDDGSVRSLTKGTEARRRQDGRIKAPLKSGRRGARRRAMQGGHSMFEGRVAIVTGGARGIGAAITQRLRRGRRPRRRGLQPQRRDRREVRRRDRREGRFDLAAPRQRRPARGLRAVVAEVLEQQGHIDYFDQQRRHHRGQDRAQDDGRGLARGARA